MRQSLIVTGLILLIAGTLVFLRSVNINRIGNNQGYAPEQPIEFSHRVHSNDLEIDCLYCHSGTEKSRTAGIPAAGICMNCHRFVSAPWDSVQVENQRAEEMDRNPRLTVSGEIGKLYDAVGFNPDSMAYTDDTEPIVWTRVHDLPDFVQFNHSRHLSAGLECQECHGQVQNMERVQQTTDLSMGWCVNCHRDVNNDRVSGLQDAYASTDCGVCHY